MSMVIECGSGLFVGDHMVCQKVLFFPSIALLQGLPGWKLSQVTLHPDRLIAADTMAAVDFCSGMAASAAPSKVVLPSVSGFPTAAGATAATAGLLTLAAPALAASGERGVDWARKGRVRERRMYE